MLEPEEEALLATKRWLRQMELSLDREEAETLAEVTDLLQQFDGEANG